MEQGISLQRLSSRGYIVTEFEGRSGDFWAYLDLVVYLVLADRMVSIRRAYASPSKLSTWLFNQLWTA